ncbi:MAG: glycosyltransferase family 1 protein [Chloroflexi bacterium]|nr:glycosyltransferase family 1 protein [Chloroflexota bacterium]
MKVLIITLGSRGDVQPYVALGKGLIAAGHEPLLATAATFRDFVTEHGVPYAYVNEVIGKFISGDAAREAVARAQGIIGWIQVAREANAQLRPLQRQMLSELWAAAQEFQPDVVVHHPKALGGSHIAEALGVPGIIALPAPGLAPTAAYPALMLPKLPLGGGYNRLTYNLIGRAASLSYGGDINTWRQNELKLGKAPRFASDFVAPDGGPVPIMQAISPLVLPDTEWDAHIHNVGFWFLDAADDYTPDSALAQFLEAGDPPVYIGFGSMASTDPEKTTRLVIDALVASGERGLLVSGWGGISAADLPEHVYRIAGAPHSWLLPRVKALVHHGGAGTTAAGLRAGKPTFITPFFGDQPFWGQRVAALGVGPHPIPIKRVTQADLTLAIRMITTDSGMQENAAALGEKLRAEDGVANAIAVINQYVTAQTPNQ